MFTVRLMAANGRSLDIRVEARSESAACAAATRRANEAHPGLGWIPAYALEA